MSNGINLHAEPVAGSSSSSSKSHKRPAPRTFSSAPSVHFAYNPSSDGVDANLLILLHGRGDSEAPFAKLGKSLALPQTATLAIRGPGVVPLLEEHEREWWAETDMLGMDVPNPDPSAAIKLLNGIFDELIAKHGWAAENIHLFGFGQGGTLALEASRQYTKHSRARNADQAIGSVVSVHGPLLSLPSATGSHAQTPVLYVNRGPKTAKRDSELAGLRRGFTRVETATLPGNADISMPMNKDEWTPTMKFWSEVLVRKSAWELDGSDLYKVSSGQERVPLPSVSQNTSEDDKKEARGARPSTSPTPQASPSKSAVTGLKRGFLSRGL